MIATTGMPKLQWYELCPYMNQSDSTDMETILDHIPEFIITVLKEKSRVHIYIRRPGAPATTGQSRHGRAHTVRASQIIIRLQAHLQVCYDTALCSAHNTR